MPHRPPDEDAYCRLLAFAFDGWQETGYPTELFLDGLEVLPRDHEEAMAMVEILNDCSERTRRMRELPEV